MSTGPGRHPCPPDLSALLTDPALVPQIPAEQIPAVLAQLAGLQAALLARLLTSPAPNAQTEPVGEDDRLVTVQEAAQRLGVAKDWVYRRAAKLPFTVRLGTRLRFSADGIERFIRQRQGR